MNKCTFLGPVSNMLYIQVHVPTVIRVQIVLNGSAKGASSDADRESAVPRGGVWCSRAVCTSLPPTSVGLPLSLSLARTTYYVPVPKVSSTIRQEATVSHVTSRFPHCCLLHAPVWSTNVGTTHTSNDLMSLVAAESQSLPSFSTHGRTDGQNPAS